VFPTGFAHEHRGFASFDREPKGDEGAIWPPRCGGNTFIPLFGEPILNRNRLQNERRKWARLPLAIPVFVRSCDKAGKELLEFATALNVSATGALVAVRPSLTLSAQVSLEIPCVPLASTAALPKSSRIMRARTVWISHAATHQLVGLRFSQPLLGRNPRRPATRRKAVSSV
jgi:hypothetical protein